MLWCLWFFLDDRKLSCWAGKRRCEAIREAQASAVSSYLYRNSPETQTHLVFNLIDRNMTNPPKEHQSPQLVWHLVFWQVSPPGGSALPTADSEQQCVGAQSDGRIPETESSTRYFSPFFNRKQLILQKLHCVFPLFRCVTLKVEMINWQNNKRCKHGGEKQHAHKSRRCNLQVIRIRLGRHAKVKEGSWPEKDSSTGWGFVNM